MRNKIIELLPSKDLKAKIFETNYQLSDMDFFQIIYEYAPNLQTRLDMISEFQQIADKETAALARKIVDNLQQQLERFIKPVDNCVFELIIKETPTSYEEGGYLCKTYEDALQCIDTYYKYWKENELPTAKYTIKKREIYSKNYNFDDIIGEIELKANKVVTRIYEYTITIDYPFEEFLLFPNFAEDYALIKYYDYNNKLCYAVNLTPITETIISDYYTMPIDSNKIKYHDYQGDFSEHEHIMLPQATVANVDELDDKDKANYHAFVKYLKDNKFYVHTINLDDEDDDNGDEL